MSDKSLNNSQSENTFPTQSELMSLLDGVRLADKALLKSRIFGSSKIKNEAKRGKVIEDILNKIQTSVDHKLAKQQSTIGVAYPANLPVSQSVKTISEAIENHQVVIIAGETGSGKTTQIPKICLELGRGVEGMIGHTQPRRIAARTVANRISEELNSELGNLVGYKVRFTDKVSDKSYIKLMTDGILLAEMQQDRLLRQYDTLIIDEAHERSLNIDFILGYLRQILPKRPDLKVIITSATIDPQRFAKHFQLDASKEVPIIEVSGRTFPVEMRYRPLNEEQEGQDVISGIVNAIDELDDLPLGDILVFLNGEREIRDTAAALEKMDYRDTQILPLFSRLSVQDQNKIFQSHRGRNIVLATNVAETSLTVPGIRYVIDPGTARISRYSYRTKVQRLPIEPVSQASANQRAGRCGRVAEGVCIRLYSEEDYLSRPEFTDPEILRTNLATVILQMLALDLGDIKAFPFVQAPDNRNISDGVRLLDELAAIEKRGDKSLLTKQGRLLAKFPVDPRLAKMVLASAELGCLEQIMVIVSALSIQDPRERPHEKQQAADEKHSRFKHKESDFLSYLLLWQYIENQQSSLSNNQFRRACQKDYLSYIRVREWQDIFSQLKLAVKDSGLQYSALAFDSEEQGHANLIHQAMLPGLLSHLGQLDENREYKGARNSRFFIFPGSGLAKKSPKWLMAAELVETSRLFARTVAKIDSTWIEPAAEHLIKRSYSEPHWEKKQGAVMAFEQLSLYGLIIVAKRKINFHQIEPRTCREIFIREALVNGDATINESFFHRNKDLLKEVDKLEQKARRKDFLVDEQILFDFFDKKLPEKVICQRSFLAWWKTAKIKTPKLLNYSRELLLNEDKEKVTKQEFPDTWKQDAITLPLTYHFSPGDIDDGVSLNIPIGILNQVQNIDFDWQIPALRYELMIAIIKGLPKATRRNFVPAPNYAQACFDAIVPGELPLAQAMAKQLFRMTGVRVEADMLVATYKLLPDHLKMNFKILNEKGKVIEQGRDLIALQEKLQGKVKASIQKVADKGIEQQNITKWDFKPLPKQFEKKVGPITIKAFPALVDKKSSVSIELFENDVVAARANELGVARMILLNIPSPIKYLQQKLPNKAKLGLYFNPFGSIQELLNDCILAACIYLVKQQDELPVTEQEFETLKDYVRGEIADTVLTLAIQVEKVLALSHEVNKKLKGKIPLNLIQASGDIKQHVKNLVYKGFVTDSGFERMSDLARYLNADLRRLEKINIDPNQDRLKLIDIEKATELVSQAKNKAKQEHLLLQELDQVKWMIEELRVSLFAQNLKTPYPISLKRVQNHVNQLIKG